MDFDITMIVQYIYTAVIYFIWVRAIDSLFETRFGRKTTTIAEILCVFFEIYLSVFLPYHSTLRTLLTPAFILLEVFALFKARWYQKVLAFLLTALSQLAGEILIPGTLMTPEEVAAGISSVPIARQLLIFTLSFLLYAVLLICVNVAWKSVQKRRFLSIPAGTWAVWLIFPASQFFLLIRWLVAEENHGFGAVTLLLVIAVCTAANALLLRNISRTAELAMVNAQNEVLSEQLSYQKAHYAALTDQYVQVRKMRHDINNHLFTMQTLLDEGKTQEVDQYLSTLREEQRKTRQDIPCEHVVAGAFLSGRSRTMKEQGIRFDCAASIPEMISVSDLDLITALGNLCDNAQEACAASDAEEKVVHMEISQKDSYLVIHVSNPAPAKKNRTRRIAELERGLGSQILSELAARYDGEYSTDVQNGTFDGNLILKCERNTKC